MSESSLHVLVIGGGLGGLCQAQGLHRHSVSVAVCERDASPVARGQGYRVHIDTRGEWALRACLPPALYELYEATRGQPSKAAYLFSVEDQRLKEVHVARQQFDSS